MRFLAKANCTLGVILTLAFPAAASEAPAEQAIDTATQEHFAFELPAPGVSTADSAAENSLAPFPVVTVYAREEPLRDVLRDIAIQTGSRLRIEGQLLNVPISLSASRKHLAQVMDALCEVESCRWKWESYLVVWPVEDPTPEWNANSCSSSQ